MTVKNKTPISIDGPIPTREEIRLRFSKIFKSQAAHLQSIISPLAEEAEKILLECVTVELRPDSTVTIRAVKRLDSRIKVNGYKCLCASHVKYSSKFCHKCGRSIEWVFTTITSKI